MKTGLVEKHLAACRLCPRRCGARRLAGELGPCGAGKQARLASAVKHVGEEPPISGIRGSATFFFSHCPLSCRFCQNFPISQMGHGAEMSIPALADRMVKLEKRGAHNINIVTGTHFAPHIIEAVALARQESMAIPVVWNTSGYETPETLDLLAGTVDIYLTDIKYADDAIAERLSDAKGYFAVATNAARKMLEQVGPLTLDAEGIGVKGVIVRHMVLPGGLSGTREVMAFVHDAFGDDVPVSLMGQYFPAHRASEISEISRPLRPDEYLQAKSDTVAAGIEEGWFQEMDDPEMKRGA